MSRTKTGAFMKCSYCTVPVWVRKHRFGRANYFCSRTHQVQWMKDNAHKIVCAVCKVEFHCPRSEVKWRNRKTCSEKCKGALRRIQAEARWTTGVKPWSRLKRDMRYSKRMEDWRKSVFERDGYVCQVCGQKGGYLHADHIKPFAYYPDLRFELSNGRTLCVPCHKKTDTYGRKAITWAQNHLAQV